MRKFTALATLTVLGLSTAAGLAMRSPSDDTMTADIERDLQLAAAAQPQRTSVVSAIEQGRNGAPSGESRGTRMVVPTKKRAPSAAVSPDVMDTPVETLQAETPATVPATVTTETVAVASSTGESASDAAPPDLSYPTPAEAPAANSGNASGGGSGGSGNGSAGGSGRGSRRMGGVTGVVLGAILRGASVGHDKCEPVSARRPRDIDGTILGQIGGVINSGGNSPTGAIPSDRAPRRGW